MADGMHYWNGAMHAIPIQLPIHVPQMHWQSYLIWFDCIEKRHIARTDSSTRADPPTAARMQKHSCT